MNFCKTIAVTNILNINLSFSAAYCDVEKLNASIAEISGNVTKVQELSDKTSSAQVQMRNILDCNPDTDGGHNEWLWEIFDKLCEYKAFLPSIHEDMNIKMGMLTAERDRCMGRCKLSIHCLLFVF